MRVIRSRDDVLFLIGGSNDVLNLYEPSRFAAAVSVAGWQARLSARTALFARMGIPWCQILAPEKLSILGLDTLTDFMADPVPPGTRLCDALTMACLVDPGCYLRDQHKRGYAVYPRTDSHWTSLGAFCAFQWAAPTLGIAVDDAVFHAAPIEPLVYHGDLWDGAHADIAPERFDRRRLPSNALRSYANAIVLLKEREHRENETGLHVGSHVIYRNDNAPLNERLMLFGSSFSDYRPECSLMTFATIMYFREVHFVWSTSLDVALIARVAPDRVLVEIPERFLTVCPDDCFSVSAYEADIAERYGNARPL